MGFTILFKTAGAMLVVGLCLAAGSATQPAAWPSFRGGPAQNGLASALSVAPAQLRRLWTYDAGHAIQATAAIAGASVVIATTHGDLLALDLATGKPRWKHNLGSAITASPCILGNSIFVGDESGRFHARSLDEGTPLWQFKAEDKIVSSAISAVLLSGPNPRPVVLTGSYDRNVYCLDARTGEAIWSFRTDAQVHASPAVAAGLVLIGGCDGKFRGLELETGAQRWAIDIGSAIASSAAVSQHLAVVGTMDGPCLGIKIDGQGQVAWKVNAAPDDGGTIASAALSADLAVLPLRSGLVVGLDPSSGATRWTYRSIKDQIESSPLIAGQAIFLGAGDGKLRALDVKLGRLLWSFDAGAEIKASPAMTGERLVIGTTDGAVYCFGP